MTQYFKKVVLDFSGGANPQRIVAKRGDKKSRHLKIVPIINGQQLMIDDNCTIDFRCVKPDKKVATAKAERNSDGEIILELPEQSLAVNGDVKSDIAIIGNQGEILSSSMFIIEVRNSPDINDYIPSEDYFKRQSDIDMNNHSVTHLATPTADHHAVNKAYVDVKVQALKDSEPELITFNTADFSGDEPPVRAEYSIVDSHIIFIAIFNTSKLNISIPEGADFSLHKVLIEDEAFAPGVVDRYIKNIDSFSEELGEGWITEGTLYSYIHAYNFGNLVNAQAALEEIQNLNITGFQVLVQKFNQITAQEVEV